MTSDRTRLPLVAAVCTVALAWLVGRGDTGESVAASLAMPLVVPALWTAAGLALAQWRQALPAAAVAAVGGSWLATGMHAALVVGLQAAGLAGGSMWRRGWRPLTVAGLCALCLVPGVFIGLAGTTVPAAFEAVVDDLREQYADGLPADMSVAERTAALSAFDDALAGTVAMQRRLWPSLLALGLLLQAAVFLAVGGAVARVSGHRPPATPWRSFVTWRAPFWCVWCLIVGLILGLTPLGGIGLSALADAGWNLVLAAAILLAGQGVAVQAWLGQRLLPPAGQALLWVLGALFLAPVVVGSGALIGLADQWWDLRRLRRSTAGNGT